MYITIPYVKGLNQHDNLFSSFYCQHVNSSISLEGTSGFVRPVRAVVAVFEAGLNVAAVVVVCSSV